MTDLFKRALGEEVREEKLAPTRIPVSQDLGDGKYVPHENIYLVGWEIKEVAGSNNLVLTFEKKYENSETKEFVVIGRSEITIFNNINHKSFDGTVEFSAEEIFKNMTIFQEQIIHIISAFVPRKYVKVNIFEGSGLSTEDLGEAYQNNNRNVFKQLIPLVYTNCVNTLINTFNDRKNDILSSELKVKFIRKNQETNFPKFPTYYFEYKDSSTNEIRYITNNFISTISDVQKCNNIKYTPYELGDHDKAKYNQADPNNVSNTQNNQHEDTTKTTANPFNKFNKGETEEKINPFARK